jgi:hypothetical protein
MLVSRHRAHLVALLVALCCAAPAALWAQGHVYKQVGPDGRVTFTDKPPPEEPAPAHASPAPATPSAPAAASAPQSKANARKAAASEPVPVRAVLDPAVDKGLSVLMGYQSLVSEYLDLCLTTLPTSYKRYDSAAQTWKTRHAAVLARYPVVLQDNYTAAEQVVIRREIQDKTRAMMAPIAASDMGRRIKWCDDNALQLQTGKMDLPRSHIEALMNYKPRR